MNDDESDRPGESKQGAWEIRSLRVDGLDVEVEITEDGITLGRDPANAVALSEQHSGVSAHHARVVLRDGVPYVEDLGSKNGTLIAGSAVRRRELRHGDVLELGAGGPRFAVVSSAALLSDVSGSFSVAATPAGRNLEESD